jgi:DNA polymerase-3 subunit beta
MKFVVNKNILLKYINFILGVTPSKSTVPVLEKAFFAAKKGQVTVFGTDFERSVSVSFSAKVDQEGEFVVDPRTLKAVIEYAPTVQDFVVSLNQGGVLIESDDGSISANLGIFDREDFPNEPQFEQEYDFSVEARELNSALGFVEFAAASDLTRVEFNSVYFDSTPEGFNLVSTDSIVLAKVTMPALSNVFSFILPIKSVRLLRSFFGEGTMSVKVSKNLVVFSGDDLKFTSRIIDGKFPDYERVIPKNVSNKIVTETKELTQAGKMIQGMNQQNQGMNITVDAQSTVMTCESDKGVGYVSKKINLKSADSDLKVRFYTDKLLGILKHISGEVELLFSDDAPQALIKDPNNGSIEYVLMPQRGEQ